MEYSFFLRQKRIAINKVTTEFTRFLISEFAKHQCKFLLIDNEEEDLKKTANWIEDTLELDVDIYPLKTISFESMKELLDTVTAIGGIDILINVLDSNADQAFSLSKPQELNKFLQERLIYPTLLSQHLIAEAYAHGHGWGRIINIYSDIKPNKGPQKPVLADNLIENIIDLMSTDKAEANIKFSSLFMPSENDQKNFLDKILSFIKEQ